MTALPASQPIKYYYRGDREVEEEATLKSMHFCLDSNGVAVLTANTPKTLNSWTANMMFEMQLLIEHCKRDPKVKCLVWTGAGKAFSAGANFVDRKLHHDQEVVDGYERFGKASMKTEGASAGDMALKGLVVNMMELEKPSICAVNGVSVGGAVNFSLLLHDFVLCSTEAKFRYPFTSLGLTPEVSSSFVLPGLVGMHTAKRWIMLGDWFPAEEVREAKLCLSVEKPEDLLPKALELASKLAPNSATLGLQKRVMHGNTWFRLREAMDLENRVIGDATQAPAFQQAMMNFAKQHSKSKL